MFICWWCCNRYEAGDRVGNKGNNSRKGEGCCGLHCLVHRGSKAIRCPAGDKLKTRPFGAQNEKVSYVKGSTEPLGSCRLVEILVEISENSPVLSRRPCPPHIISSRPTRPSWECRRRTLDRVTPLGVRTRLANLDLSTQTAPRACLRACFMFVQCQLLSSDYLCMCAQFRAFWLSTAKRANWLSFRAVDFVKRRMQRN